MSSLGYAVLGASNGTRAVSTVAVAVLIDIVARDSLAPMSTALELLVLVVDTGIDDVDINALATFRLVDVLVEVAKPEPVGVRDTSQPPRGPTLSGQVGRGFADSIDNLIALDKVNLGESTDLVESAIGELASIPLDVAVVDVGQPGAVSKRIGLKTNASAPDSIHENTVRWHTRLAVSRGANNISK